MKALLYIETKHLAEAFGRSILCWYQTRLFAHENYYFFLSLAYETVIFDMPSN